MNCLRSYNYACGIVDDNVKSFGTKMGDEIVQYIYCGVTNKTVDEQLQKHVEDDNDIIDSTYKICELTWYKLNKSEGNLNDIYAYVNKMTLEKLTRYLTKVYGERCINEQNVINDIMLLENDGEEFGDVMTYYVVYKS